MKTCEKCKRVFQDEMNFCPYCGTKVHDYKDDLRQAMNELFDEEKTILSRVKSQEILKEEKRNAFLNKILFVFIVLMIGTLLVGGIMISEKILPGIPTVTEYTNSKNDEYVSNDSSETLNENDQDDEVIHNNSNEGVVDVSNMEDGDFYIEKMKVKKEKNQIRIDIQCKSLIDGDIFLKDEDQLNIGPIKIKEGNNKFYFLVSGQVNYKLYFDANNGKDYEYLISKEMLDKVLNND